MKQSERDAGGKFPCLLYVCYLYVYGLAILNTNLDFLHSKSNALCLNKTLGLLKTNDNDISG